MDGKKFHSDHFSTSWRMKLLPQSTNLAASSCLPSLLRTTSQLPTTAALRNVMPTLTSGVVEQVPN
jgi:hypothetical protein